MMNDNEEEQKSRSQLKREHNELKDLGTQLVGLTPGELRSIPLSEEIHEAILAAKKLVRGSARQRQIRRLAQLIEEEDVVALRSSLSDPKPQAAALEAERWRDALIAGDDEVLMQFVEDHPIYDRQHLRQLAQNARKELKLDKPPKSARRLFQYLKSMKTADK